MLMGDGPSRPVLNPEWLPTNTAFSPATAMLSRIWSKALH
jgi:hypothetical protein